MSELEKIKRRYEERKKIFFNEDSDFRYFMCYEREQRYTQIVQSYFPDLTKIKILEIGAGNGSNLLFFYSLGIPYYNIFANELLQERGEMLKKNLPNSFVDIGNAIDLPFNENFDIVFQSTVFTSILDKNFKKQLAHKMLEMTKSNGIVLWYDFKYNNPKNKDVKGVTKNEIMQLFPLAKKIRFYNVTLAPPIGRKVGKFYNYFNVLFPFLRSHLIAVIQK